MHVTNVAGVATVAAAKILGGAFQHEHLGAGPSSHYRGAEPGIAAANNQHVKGLCETAHACLKDCVVMSF